MKNNRKGYRVERKIRLLLQDRGWEVVRSGGSLGLYDLIAFKNGKAIFIQVKSTKKDTLYYYGYMKSRLAGFPFVLVVDFGRGNIVATKPKRRVSSSEKTKLSELLERGGNGFQ